MKRDRYSSNGRYFTTQRIKSLGMGWFLHVKKTIDKWEDDKVVKVTYSLMRKKKNDTNS